jgi:hypothetical protein
LCKHLSFLFLAIWLHFFPFFWQCVFEHDAEKGVAIKSKEGPGPAYDPADKENVDQNKTNAMT